MFCTATWFVYEKCIVTDYIWTHLQCKTTISNVFELIYKNRTINEQRDWERCQCFCTSTSCMDTSGLESVTRQQLWAQRCFVERESAALWRDARRPPCAPSLMVDRSSAVSILTLLLRFSSRPENIIIHLRLNCRVTSPASHQQPKNKKKNSSVFVAKQTEGDSDAAKTLHWEEVNGNVQVLDCPGFCQQ